MRRSRAREVALQLLYQHDLNPGVRRKPIERFVRERLRDAGPARSETGTNGAALETFALALYDGVLAHLADIDRHLTQSAENWRLSRMAIVDRNVLRLGAFELLFTPETPPGVILNEAIELARRYGSLDSPSFVNGVLDRLHKKVPVQRPQQADNPSPA